MTNGVDDLLGVAGPDEVLGLFKAAEGAPDFQKTQAQVLIELADGAEFFHSPSGEGFARLEVEDHHEVWSLRSAGFRQWLILRYFRKVEKPPSAQALQDAIGVLAAKAQFDGQEISVAVRVAEHGGKIYIDLGNDKWSAVEIDAHRWRVVSNPPVRFKRARGMTALPTPTIGGSITQLRKIHQCRRRFKLGSLRRLARSGVATPGTISHPDPSGRTRFREKHDGKGPTPARRSVHFGRPDSAPRREGLAYRGE